ncbi:uncharacterized protein LOC131034818 [Cryptomeria japonica]|uniref:uncharacterized protein LOC131034818 n=1 Tax=Cryptomeria japonica TaxID=3369 RepID=UPI0027DA96EF|nr:uncharacterized protein LOC131034818 [Cryptomeria japonica]
MQEKRAHRNEMQRARYHGRKIIINKSRRETQHTNLEQASTSIFSSSQYPIELQTHVPQLEHTSQPIPIGHMHTPPNFSQNYCNARNKFRSTLDKLSKFSTCLVCMEKYPGIKTRQQNGINTCYRCTSEKNGHRFSKWNNMDPGEQPHCLQILTQVEEMLIARVSPVLQVTYARGGQLKYSGHTISFPQDISAIVSHLPRRVDGLDIIIVNRETGMQQQYNFYVSRGRVYDALQYKMSYDQYYKDVQVDIAALISLPLNPTNISSLLHATTSNPDPIDMSFMQEKSTEDDPFEENLETTISFVANLPPSCREVEEVRYLLQLGKGRPPPIIQWPPISPFPINEYNTEGLFVMSFPTLFPKGIAAFKQPRPKDVKLHEYALHLLRYHDNRFGQHPRFRYFILNIIMRHRSQATSSIFVQKQIHDELPATIGALRQRLKDLPNDKLADQLMRFSSSIHGTKPFWNQHKRELIDMVIQIGCPTLFFTLSVADTKWPDLHTIMPSTTPTNPYAASKWRLQNIVQNPHLTALYMHHRFTAFRAEVLEKLLGATDYWYRYDSAKF